MADMTLEQVANELRITARSGASLAPQTCHYLADAIDAAIKQREQGAKDAARYRWLRDMRNREQAAMLVSFKMNLDAEIDAAMAKESGR